jgi:hypothetical protein
MIRYQPLVQVSKSGSLWDYVCLRCGKEGWDRTWASSFDRAFKHAARHTDVGFQRPKGS